MGASSISLHAKTNIYMGESSVSLHDMPIYTFVHPV